MKMLSSKTRLTSLFLAAFLLASTLILSLHSHKAEAKHSEHCVTCHLQQDFSHARTTQPFAVLPVSFCEEILQSQDSIFLVRNLALLGKSSQAPPFC